MSIWDFISNGIGFGYHKWFSSEAKLRSRRIEQLGELLKDRSAAPTGIRSLETLARKTGMDEQSCRDLLAEIGAVGMKIADGKEGWKLPDESIS